MDEAKFLRKSNRQGCAYCKVAKAEEKSARKILSTNSFACFSPFAPRYPFEVMILPFSHIPSFASCSRPQFLELAQILKSIAACLASWKASYNFFLRSAPVGEKDFHFSFRLEPRLSTWGGFEEQTGIIINAVAPETAAGHYREALKNSQ